MGNVLLLHSVRGLRDLERQAAARMQAAGHHVALPDLFGELPATLEDGFALEERLWPQPLLGRALAAAETLPPDAVLAGFSMGAAIAMAVWDERPAAAGLLLLHGLGGVPAVPLPAVPIQAHIAEPDPFLPEDEIAAWGDAAAAAGLGPEIFRYAGAGHLFTDPTLPDHNPEAAAMLWQRADAFLAAI